jgi:hypothetical protein
MKIELVHTYGWMDALRGMRNPLNSWNRADSTCKCDPVYGSTVELNIGPNDEKLIKALTIGGSPHRKFLRSVFVSMDITAPTYWWAEMDTYKIPTVRNSCSFQHKGASRDFTTDDFTLEFDISDPELAETAKDITQKQIELINQLRVKYNETKDYKYFRLMRQILPTGYDYKATWTGNYETLMNIYFWRHNHKLSEWHVLCDEIMNNCPYFSNLVNFCNSKKNTIDN